MVTNPKNTSASSSARGLHAVNLLKAASNDATLLPGTPGYEQARQGFWSVQQARCTPYAICQPASAQDVSTIISILRKTGCPFGIKSGGHGRLAGESSISEGVLIDLKRLNTVQLSQDRSTCRVGPGNAWARVYQELNAQGLTVVGGRASTVGVGGFCLSGGISFFSNRHGWAMDNVASFEIVLADGSIVNANPSSHPDLYKALRGGGANFGVIVSLDLFVYPYEGIWGGEVTWPWERLDAVIDAFIEYGSDNVGNVDQAIILGTVQNEGKWIVLAEVEHLKPAPPPENSALRRLLDIPCLLDGTGPTSMISRTDSIAGSCPPGTFQGYWTICTQLDKRIIRYFFDTWRQEIAPLIHFKGLDRFALADVNIASQNVVDAMRRNGGNALDIADQGPFMVLLMEPLWIDESITEGVTDAMRSTAEKTAAEAKRLGLSHGYIYLNYAHPFQDVYSGYGAGAKQFLATVSKKYDAKGMFQHQRAAGWHLHGPLKTPPKETLPTKALM